MLENLLIGQTSEPSDPYFENVTLLLHGDGTNGGQNNTFVDSSTNNFTITRNGNTTQGSFSPYGDLWSNYFDGNGDYLSFPSNSAFSPGTGDFTIECWAYLLATSGEGTLFYVNATNGINLFLSISGNWGIGRSGVAVDNDFGATPSLNTWNHLAVSRSGSTIRAFVNGTQVFSGANTSNYAQGAPRIADSGGFGTSTGYVSNFRFVKGTAIYTSAFTPPTAPLTAITNTSLLTCQSNRFVDNSSNNFTITRNGDVSVQRFSPFSPTAAYSAATIGGSGYFDGTGDYLTVPDNAALELGSSNFTIEAWVYANSTSSEQYICSKIKDFGSFALYIQGGAFKYNLGSTGSSWNIAAGVSGGSVAAGQWVHIALVRNGSTFTPYVNGVAGTTATSSSSLVDNAEPLAIGAAGVNSSPPYQLLFNGYISNFRIVKGTAVYTSAFTPPTAPLTAITNTSLLLNFTNASIFDNAMMADLETVGNAQIDTAVKKFGTGSLEFDGTGDYLVAPGYSSAITLGSGNFTWEAWIYANSVAAGTRDCFGIYDGGSTGIIVGQVGSNIRFFCEGTTITSSSTISANTWYHIAAVRSGTTGTLYINGTSVGSATISAPSNVNFSIGRAGNFNGNYFNGYIDDLRITRGVARYTANFTPPSAPFPNK